MPPDLLDDFARWWRRRFGRRPEQYVDLYERLRYATTEQEVRAAVVDYNHEIARDAFIVRPSRHDTQLLDPEDVLKEWRARPTDDM
jgi:hypothetical protein